jgi:hypothetical protein
MSTERSALEIARSSTRLPAARCHYVSVVEEIPIVHLQMGSRVGTCTEKFDPVT